MSDRSDLCCEREENQQLKAEVSRLREAMTELRRWVGDGDCSDDRDIWPGYATTAYIDAVRKADKALLPISDELVGNR